MVFERLLGLVPHLTPQRQAEQAQGGEPADGSAGGLV
jgi:hypothetical protein